MQCGKWIRFVCLAAILFVSKSVGASDFLNAPFAAHADFGLGAAFGPATFEERDMFEVTVVYDNGDTLDGKPIHSGFRMGPRFDFTPLRRKNKKFGFRVGYDFAGIRQNVSVGDDTHENQNWKGWLAKRNNILAGPIFIWGKPRDAQRVLFGTLFAITGPNLGGKYVPAPGAKDFGAVGDDESNTGFGGWRIDVGAGIGGARKAFLYGLNVVWTGNIIALDKKVYVDIPETTLINEINFSAYLGFFLL